MAKVSLRIYNREIEGMIDQGRTDEAIAHCHHILKTFPKHLETYRLLGKSYLESKRYNDAVDIFGRVLMSVPDDFVAHVGMSIIRDDENKLDDSIWHMERAFEAQPSNAAIQGELQRLYGRRDGMEPPKIRMTRGALAHMYVQGELYPQAIAEIRAVLSDDPQRGDMQVLLALSYFKAGQKSDASDMCTQLLKRYPFCFDANRIMVELLHSTTEAAESTQAYRMRVGELDPYATFAKGSVFQSNEVADAAVNLDRLEYTGEEVPMGQEWGSSLGIGLGASAPALGATSSTDQPDWLKSGGFFSTSSQAAPAPAPASDSNDEIPDFLRAAGWGESSTPEQPTSIFDEEPASGDLTPAELPDWLKGQVPSSSAPPTKPLPDHHQAIATPDWLTGLGDSQVSEPAQPGNVPDWLSGSGASQSSESEPAPTGDVPDWLSELDDSKASEPAQVSNIPDWLGGMDLQNEPPQPTPSVESLGATAQEQDDAVAWLESLAAKHGAKPEELVTDPNKRFEKPPEWVSQAQNLNQQTPVSESPAPSVESLGTTAQEQDDAVAWLESLAAKHGAKPEELVTDPSKRFEKPPEWVSQAQSIGEAQAASDLEQSAASDRQPESVENALNIGEQFFAEFETSSTAPAVASNDIPDWVGDLQPKSDQLEEQGLQRSDVPEWLSDAQTPPGSGGQFEFAEPSETSKQNLDLPNWLSGVDEEYATQDTFGDKGLSNNDLSDWLSGLDNEPGLPFEPMPTPDSILTAPRSAQFDAKPANQEPVADYSKLPDWLQGVDEKIDDVDQTGGEDDTPPWLHREQWEAEGPQQPKPTSPSDWHPIESPVVPKQEAPPVEMRKPFVPPPPEPSIQQSVEMRVPEKPVVPAKKKPGLPAKQRQADGQNVTVALNQAKSELDRGDIPAALEHYGKLIKKGKHLEETIRDLTESIYRYPVEVGIWQTLGDAYMRANRLKEALEAYNKAEELIR